MKHKIQTSATTAAAETPAATDAPEVHANQVAQSTAPQERVVVKDAQGRSYGTGRRKDAVARVWVKQGSGRVVVNGKDQTDYFSRNTHRLILNQPFLIVNAVGQYEAKR